MGVITISRQLGSLGRDVAQRVAERMGYRFVWRDVINEAARRASAPEVALATIDELDLLGLIPSPNACKAYCQSVQQVMEELAHEGDVVILGRAGQIVLREFPGVFSVRVIAPAALRARRVAEAQGVTMTAAQSQVEASDKHRQEYLERFYQARWDDPALYDLVINTARLEIDDAADMICQHMLRRNAMQSPASSR